MTRQNRFGRSITPVVWALALVLVLAACGGGNDSAGGEGSGGADGGGTTVRMTVEPSAIPAFVAADRGFFEGIEVEVSQVGYDDVQALLVAGDTDVAWISPLEAARFVAEGEDFRYFSTAGAQNMYNGVVVRAEDADTYQTVEDLQGERLGIPGFATGTWTAFEVFMRAYYDIENARNAFQNSVADSGALLALLERGEIDAALLFSGSSAAARSLEQFETIFSFTEVFREETGEPMAVNGSVARADWLEANPDAAQSLVEGLDEAVEWIQDNSAEFEEDGQYADLAEGAGFLTDAQTIASVTELMERGEWYLSSEIYTDGWIDAVYELVEAGEGSIVQQAPAKGAVFADPDEFGASG